MIFSKSDSVGGGVERTRALARMDLLVMLAVLALLAVIALPALAGSRPRSARVICANNLRQIGVALQAWGNDHADRLPQEVAVSDGGTMQHPLAVNVWLHLAWISNEVAAPKIFLCPSDSGDPALDFSGASSGGYLNPRFANRATSYFLGYNDPFFANNPYSAIAGDRNIATLDISPAGCSRFNTALSVLDVSVAWTIGLHGQMGNVLGGDGSIHQVDNLGLRRIFARPPSDNGNVMHIITPR